VVQNFRKAGQDVNNYERQGVPVELVCSAHQLTCRMIVDELHMSKMTVRKILVQDFGMINLAVKLMP
jgi:hypothetical protein